MNKIETGRAAEDFAAQKLAECGWEIVATRSHSRYGEIDIIAKNDKFIAFVEVKCRSDRSFYTPAEAVTPAKMRKILKTAAQYLVKNPTALQPRFDIFEVITTHGRFCPVSFNHIENAFLAEDSHESV